MNTNSTLEEIRDKATQPVLQEFPDALHIEIRDGHPCLVVTGRSK